MPHICLKEKMCSPHFAFADVGLLNFNMGLYNFNVEAGCPTSAWKKKPSPNFAFADVGLFNFNMVFITSNEAALIASTALPLLI